MHKLTYTSHKRLRWRRGLILGLSGLILPTAMAQAEQAPAISGADTGWLLVSTALVLFMMIPALALFYGGLVRTRNVLSLLMQCFSLTAVMTLLWLAVGYTLTFTTGGSLIGGMSKLFLKGVDASSVHPLLPTVPELSFFGYQMMFFLITPGLFIGAFAERMKFSAIMLFSMLWSLVVYVPVAYGIWNTGNFFGITGTIDLAGGIVIHVTAGVAALVACIMVGPRQGFPQTAMMPHNLVLTVTGAAMLWVGWFGFNGGGNLPLSGSTAMTVVVTHISAASACVVWSLIEWVVLKKPSVLGIATGSIAGLAAITPASGKVGPLGAVCIGSISALLCWIACAKLKKKFRYDDSLDVFGVHGIGGLVGSLLVAVFGSASLGWGGTGDYAIGAQLTKQALACLYTAALSGVATFVILTIIKVTIGLRVDEAEEAEGLDLAEHGESAYNDS
jgi:ammonium transporter, Amt family